MRSLRISRLLICFILCLGLVFGSALPSFAATSVDQETLYPLLKLPIDYGLTTYNNGTTYMYRNNGLGYALGIMGQVLSRSLYQIISNTSNIYSAVDGVESSLSTISGKIKDYTSYIDGLEGFVDGLESALSTNNTRLQSILTAVQGISTYNYTSTLNSILANTNYLGSIESDLQVSNDALGTSNTGIWGAVSGASHFLGLIQPDISSISSVIGTIPSVSYSYISGWNTDNNFNVISSKLDILPKYTNSGYPVFTTPYGTNPSIKVTSSLSSKSLSAFIQALNLNTIALNNSVWTPFVEYNRFRQSNGSGGTSFVSYKPSSLADLIWLFNDNVIRALSPLQFVLADSDTIQRKNDNAALTSGALDQVTGDGSAAASLSDFTFVSSGLGDIKSSVSGGASASSAFAVLNGGSNAWDWFSEDCKNDMDSTSGDSSSGSRSFKSVSRAASSSTPLLDQYYFSVLSFLGGGSDD